MIRFLSFLFLIFSLSTVHAQKTAPCATDENYRAQIIQHPELFKLEDDANAQIRKDMNSLLLGKAGTVRYIPVVFHIIHGNGFENISQAQIMDQIRILNEDFRKMVGTNGFSAHPLAADMEIEFRLAQYDPNGKKHDGINRIYNPTLDSNATDATKALITWDSKKYLNVWIVNSINASSSGFGTVLGYAQFPWQLSTSGSTDGILMRADQVGSISFGDPSQAGRTLTHEIGHWLGLYHTFQGGCVGNLSSNCQSQGDQVCDTPPVLEASFGCQTGKNSCTNDRPDSIDLIKDYMDYSDGNCLNMFTTGQKTRVNNTMTYRQGIFGPSPSFVQNLTYAGINADGSYTIVPASVYKAPYVYGFEEINPLGSGWRYNNFNTPSNGWQINTSVSHSGSNCMYMRNFTNPTVKINSRDGFQTPEIDLTTVATPTLEFYYAYAQKNSATNDSMVVRISNNFGMEETYVWRSAGASMSTAGIQSNEYFPIAQEWQKVSVNLSPFKNYTHARFRFELLNRRGNNIYVDDVTIRDGATGTEEVNNVQEISLYPNPFNDKSTLSFQLKEQGKVTLRIIDMTGKTVMAWDEKEFNAGRQSLEISRGTLPQGIYLLLAGDGKSVVQHKMLIY